MPGKRFSTPSIQGFVSQRLRQSIEVEGSEGSEFERFAAANLYIRTEDRQVSPYVMREVQRELEGDLTGRDIVLKARKHGVSTHVAAKFYWYITTQENVLAAVVAHSPDATQALWEIVQLFYQRDPRRLHSHYSSRRELYLDELNSRFIVLQAGEGAGRARTINYLHLSELAWWKGDAKNIAAGMIAAVPPRDTGTEIIIESTANGEGNEYHRRWMDIVNGRGDYTGHFFPWTAHPRYRAKWRANGVLSKEEEGLKAQGLSLEQIAFRRSYLTEMGQDTFRQEYPLDWQEAFLASGRPAFDRRALVDLEATHARRPIREELEGPRNYLRVYATPKRGRRYCAGVDMAEGVVGGDAQSCGVLDVETMEEVAVLHGRWPIHVFSRKAAALVNRYRAYTAPERNNHGHALIEHWLHGDDAHRVPKDRLVHHRDYDQRGKARRRPGIDTNLKTRPVMIADLEEAIRKRQLIVHEPEFYLEARAFAYNEQGKAEAPEGMHDDRVLRLALALQARKERLQTVGYSSNELYLGV